MTISTEKNKVIIPGDGSTTVFQFDFVGVDPSDIKITVENNDGTFDPNAQADAVVKLNPVLSGDVWGIGGTVTYASPFGPLPIGATLAIERVLLLEQLFSFSNQGSVNLVAIEQAIDYVMMCIQQVSGDISRAFKVPVTDPPPADVPSVAERANRPAFFDGDGNLIGTTYPGFYPVNAQIFDNISVLRGAPAPTVPGSFAQTNGYYVGGDGGHNDFLWNAGATTPDNGGSVIRPSAVPSGNPGRWIAFISEPMNILTFGAKGDGTTDNTACYVNAFAAGVRTIYTPKAAGAFVANFSIPAGCALKGDGRILGRVGIDGMPVYGTNLQQVTNGTPGNYATYPIGSTTFFIDSTAYNVGDFVSILLGSTSTHDPNINQQGRDFGIVQTKGAGFVTLDRGTKFAYDVPQLMRSIGAPYVGTLVGWTNGGNGAGAARFLPGDFTARFSAGQVVRIENGTGTDTVQFAGFNPTAYFEDNRIRAISSSGIIFQNSFAYTHTNPILSLVGTVNDIRVQGGYIDNLDIIAGGNVQVSDLDCRVFGMAWTDDGLISQVHCDSDQPRGFGFSWCRNVAVSNIIAKSSMGVTDNGAFKSLGCWDCTISNVDAYNTFTTNAPNTQTSYPVFFDFLSTPYQGYMQGCTIVNLNCDVSYSGSPRSAWFEGMRACKISGVKGVTDFYCALSRDCGLSDIQLGRFLRLRDNIGVSCSDFACQWASLEGHSNTYFGPGTIRGANGNQLGRNLQVTGSVTASTPLSMNLRIHGLTFLSTTAADITMFIQRAPNIDVDGCSDQPGLASSLQLGLGTGVINVLASNNLQNPLDADPQAYVPTVTGSVTAGTSVLTLQYTVQQLGGRVRFIQGALTWNSATGTGALTINIPAMSKNSPSSLGRIECTPGGWASIPGDAWFLQILPGTTQMTLKSLAKNTGIISDVPLQPAGNITFSGFYQTA